MRRATCSYNLPQNAQRKSVGMTLPAGRLRGVTVHIGFLHVLDTIWFLLRFDAARAAVMTVSALTVMRPDSVLRPGVGMAHG